MEKTPAGRGLDGGHVLPLPRKVAGVVRVRRLRNYVRILLVAVALPGARVVLRNRTSACNIHEDWENYVLSIIFPQSLRITYTDFFLTKVGISSCI